MPQLKNPRQERFCLEYVATGNATQSAIKAGYTAEWAGCTANRDLIQRNPQVSNRIAELRAPIEAKLAEILSPDARLQALSQIIKHKIEAPVTAGHVVAAVKEANLMEHIYEERRAPEGGITNNFLFVLPDGTKVTPRALIEGKDAIQGKREG